MAHFAPHVKAVISREDSENFEKVIESAASSLRQKTLVTIRIINKRKINDK